MINAINPFSTIPNNFKAGCACCNNYEDQDNYETPNYYQADGSCYSEDEIQGMYYRYQELDSIKRKGEKLTPEEEMDLKEMTAILGEINQNRITEEDKTTNNTSNEKKSTAAEYSEKDLVEGAAGLAAKHYISMQMNRSFIATLTKLNPATIAMVILGVDPEDCGNSLKDGAKTGEGGDFKTAFKGVIEDYDKAIEEAMKKGTWETVKVSLKETLGFVPNSGAALVNNALKYVGKGLTKVFSPEFVSMLGSNLSLAGKALNTISDSVANVVGGTLNGIKELLKGNTQKAGEKFKNIGKNFKEIGISIKDKFKEVGNDIKNWVVDKYEKTKDFFTEKVPNKAKEIWEDTKEVVKKVWKWKGWPWN